jgi:hypothetical protein
MSTVLKKGTDGARCGVGAKNCNFALAFVADLDGGHGKLSIMSVVRIVSDGYGCLSWIDWLL